MRIIAFLLVFYGSCFACISAHCETIVSGSCADGINSSCEWTIDLDRGILTLSGNGEMASYSVAEAPWYEYRNSIESVIVGSGISNISYAAFWNHLQLQNVKFETDANGQTALTSIDSWAFGETHISDIVIPDTVTDVGYYAFAISSVNGPKLMNVVIPDSLKNIGENAFASQLREGANFYCPADKADMCREALSNSDKTQQEINQMLKIYTKEGNRYVLDGQKYKTLADMQKK